MRNWLPLAALPLRRRSRASDTSGRLHQHAPGAVCAGDGNQLRGGFQAWRRDERAARRERTASGQPRQVRRRARDRLGAVALAGPYVGVQQAERVWVLGGVHDLAHTALLDDATAV